MEGKRRGGDMGQGGGKTGQGRENRRKEVKGR